MDTDDLSRESYEGILIEAEKLSHDMTLQFGVLAGGCKNETEYIDKAEKLTKKIIMKKLLAQIIPSSDKVHNSTEVLIIRKAPTLLVRSPLTKAKTKNPACTNPVVIPISA